jgi:hypothetical protein
VNKKQIDYKDARCEMLFIMDQTDQWRYHIQQHEFKQISKANNELLQETKKFLEDTILRCESLQENCRFD